MPGTLAVDLDALIQSATTVVGRGDDLHARHAGASTPISAAQGGWAGSSAAALAARVAEWNARTTSLVSRIGTFAAGMHTSAAEFDANEHDSAEKLHDVASQLPNSQ